MQYDQLFKELLHAFFREFLELFYPDIAVRLDFNRVTFLDKELFTDLPEGRQREPDVVAQVYTLEGAPELILLHVEIQSKRDREFSYRMFEYYAMLWLRYKIPIFPVVLYLTPGAGGLTEENYTASLFERNILTFQYAVVGLPDLSADDYLNSENPLGTGLSAMMQPSKLGKLAQKYSTLIRLIASPIDDARKSLLAYLITTNLQLSPGDETEFKQLMLRGEAEEVNSMLDIDELFREYYKSVYEERGLVKGIEQGIEQGIEKGVEQGILQGLIQGERHVLLKLMRQKFGELSETVTVKIEAITSEVELDTLAKRILVANSLEEMRL